MENRVFKAVKRDFSGEMVVNAAVEEVFPLLCPTRENDWLPNWEEMCDLIWSESGFAEMGAIFRTRYDEFKETWIVSRYDYPERIEFVRYNPNLITCMAIELERRGEQTGAKWSQSRVAISDEGKMILDRESQKSYTILIHKLEILLNYYASTGKMMDEETLEMKIKG